MKSSPSIHPLLISSSLICLSGFVFSCFGNAPESYSFRIVFLLFSLRFSLRYGFAIHFFLIVSCLLSISSLRKGTPLFQAICPLCDSLNFFLFLLKIFSFYWDVYVFYNTLAYIQNVSFFFHQKEGHLYSNQFVLF